MHSEAAKRGAGWGAGRGAGKVALLKALLLGGISLLLLSCETVGYYSQAVRGQMSIVFAREDIERLLQDEAVPAETAAVLRQVLEIRQFAAEELSLPVDGHYSGYVDIQRDYVVWNVFAAPEFSVDPLSWCFPVAGCVSYRGYFSESDARGFADDLAAKGYDVYVGGVDAYSTLGWFQDPLLSTVLKRDSVQLASLIFHELAHQLLYVPGDTTFNESFATAVEREGLRRWLLAQDRPDLLGPARLRRQRQAQFVALVTDYRERFRELYAEDLPAEQMRAEKQDLQVQMRSSYAEMKREWGGIGAYDAWFSRSLNNAQLSTVSSYNDLVPVFESILQSQSGDLELFYARVRELARLPEDERQAQLQAAL